jgi:sporulation integral membrane protein YlbJ
MISGTPSNSKYLKDLYDNNLICLNDVKKCLNFCHFTNPIFIIGTIGVTFLNNKELGLIILISHYLSSFILGIVLKKDNKNNQFYLDKRKQNKNTNNFITILNESIINTANTLLLILGIITFCLIITAIFDKIFNIDNNYKYIYGLLEITQGLKYLSLSNLDIKIKTIIASFIISFGGFCIHLQVFSILDNKKIRYLPYLFSRILQAVMSAIITLLIITLFG